MNRHRFSIGPGAASLILIIVVLSMSLLGVLALMNAHSDLNLSLRSMDVAAQIYELDSACEAAAARLDAVCARCAAESADDEGYLALISSSLPDGMRLSGRTVTWTQQGKGGRQIECAMTLGKRGESRRLFWTNHELLVNSEEMGLDD